MSKNTHLITFRKENGKWKWGLNPKSAFFYYQTYGMPVELFAREFFKHWNPLSKKEKMNILLAEWIDFVKENPEAKQDYSKLSEKEIKLVKSNLVKSYKEIYV